MSGSIPRRRPDARPPYRSRLATVIEDHLLTPQIHRRPGRRLRLCRNRSAEHDRFTLAESPTHSGACHVRCMTTTLSGSWGTLLMGKSGTAFVEFWNEQRRIDRQWFHPEDEKVLRGRQHSFNLDHPVVPYIGDIRRARVVILGANAGYSPDETPFAFERVDDERDCLEQIARRSTVG